MGSYWLHEVLISVKSLRVHWSQGHLLFEVHSPCCGVSMTYYFLISPRAHSQWQTTFEMDCSQFSPALTDPWPELATGSLLLSHYFDLAFKSWLVYSNKPCLSLKNDLKKQLNFSEPLFLLSYNGNKSQLGQKVLTVM